jgi:hypothetical protein
MEDKKDQKKIKETPLPLEEAEIVFPHNFGSIERINSNTEMPLNASFGTPFCPFYFVT